MSWQVGSEIISVEGREILDSRGNPTVEVEVGLANGVVSRAPFITTFFTPSM